MKLILVLGALLWFLLSWFSNSVGLKAEEITTDNLISQDFTDGSWNNPVNSWHAPNDLAGWNGIEHTTEVTHTPDTEALKENGFNMTAGAEIFHWYNNQTVHIRQSVTLDNGSVITQTKDYTASRGTVHDVENTIVINPNTSTNYDLLMGIGFTDTRGLDGHRSADVRDPYITLTYNNEVFQLDEEIENQIQEDLIIDEKIFDDFKIEDKIVMEDFKSFEEPKAFEEPVKIVEEFIEIASMPEKTPEPEVMEEMVEEFMEEVVEQKEEIKEDIKEEIAEEIKEEITEEPTKETAKETTNESKSVEAATGPKEKEIKKKETKVVSLDDVLEKIDEKVKDIGKNLQLKNLVKIKVMTSDNRLEEYNIPFYDNKIIYDNQINIADNRVIYQVDLAEYKQNDPIAKRRIKLNTILQERQDLINQLQVLKNG